MSVTTAALRPARPADNVLLEGVRVDGAVDGLIFKVALEQRFRNRARHAIEIVYTFPLPFDAVLLGVDVRLGERQLAGAVIEKRRAEQAYEDSLAAGDAAIMLEKNRDGSYSVTLGNLAADETCVTTLRYAQTLQFEQRSVRLCVPTVLAPRYGNPIRDARLAPHQVVSPELGAHHPFALTLQLSNAFALARIGSPSHPISTRVTDDGVTVVLTQSAALDRDFIVVLDQLAHDSLAIAAPDAVLPGHSAALASFCPRLAAPSPAPVHARLLVDCSGSMAGDSMQAAKRALRAIVTEFAPGDRFSLSCFGSDVHHRTRSLWASNERTRLAARRWVDELEANLGGTEMELALTSTCALDAARAGDVLLVTDGQIQAIDDVIAAARAAGQRIFVVAIGSSPAESALRRLAQATAGACDFVAPGERVEPAVLRMFARLRSPRLTGLRAHWPASLTPLWSSPMPDAVFDGDTLNLYAQFPGALGDEEVRLYACDGDQVEREIACARFGATRADDQTLARMTANARVVSATATATATATADAGADANANANADADADRVGAGSGSALRIALDYQLVTQHTNFLLVHERAEQDKASEMPELNRVAPMLAAGWGGTGSVTASLSASPSPSRPQSAMDGFAQPAVWRREAASATNRVTQVAGTYDIPAFLRRAAPQAATPPDLPSGREHWCDADDASGLTPLALNDLLRAHPPALWDRSYADLRRSGLRIAVVDWLELVVGNERAEACVVATFLFVMAQEATRGALLASRGTLHARLQLGAAWLRRWTAGALPAPPDERIDLELAQKMALHLASMSATEWPPRVLAPEGFETGELATSAI
jgi:Ca-activated chloride channel family protein